MTAPAGSFSLFHPLVLNCQSPPHLCYFDQYGQCLKSFTCPSCKEPLTIENSAESLELKIHSLSLMLQVMSVNFIRNTQAKISVRTRVEIIEELNAAVKAINANVNFYPFRGIKGLEFLSKHAVNSENRSAYAYALPGKKTAEIIQAFITSNLPDKKTLRIIEYGAGTALWSRYFLANGFNTLAIDCARTQQLYVKLPPEGSFLTAVGQEIQYVDEDYCGLPQDCSQEVLFLCWPENPKCTDYPMYAGQTLYEFRRRGGFLALYIGAPRGETTADEDFFDEIEAHWEVSLRSAKEDAFFSFDSAGFDALYLLKRREKSESKKLVPFELSLKKKTPFSPPSPLSFVAIASLISSMVSLFFKINTTHQ